MNPLGLSLQMVSFFEMKLLSLILVPLLVVTACSKKEDDTAGEAGTNNYSSGNPLTAPTDYLGAVSKGQKNATKTINMASVTQAVNLYFASEGNYPETLAKLVQEGYLASVPAAPAGQKLEYNSKTGTVTLVAVSAE